MKKRYWIIGGIVVLVIAGFLGYRALAAKQAAADQTVQTAQVKRGMISQALYAAGTVRTGQSAVINWQTSGKVGNVNVKLGDLVQVDQELANLDSTSLAPSMLNAQQSLINAKIALDDLLSSTTAQAQAHQALEDAQKALDDLQLNVDDKIAQAQLDLANAQIALADTQRTRNAMNYSHSTDKLVIEKAQTDWLLAKARYKDALQEYNKWVKKRLTDPRRVQALNNLLAARQKMDSTFATYNWYLMDWTANDIAKADANLALAKANLASAQANYDSLKGGPTSPAVALAQAKLDDAQRAWERVKDGPSQEDLDAAQAAVDSSQATLNQIQLLAPFAGTITDVNILPGDIIASGKDAFHIDDLSKIYVDVLISEVDINSLKIGQETTLTFDAIPNQTYNGIVTEIGIDGESSQGVVNYPATIQIINPDASIKPGMTASVAITIAQAEDVLLVPSSAIKTAGNQRTVTVLYQDQQIPVAVTIGLTDGSMTEVNSEILKEGDEVVLNTSTTTSGSSNQFRQQNFGGGPPGGVEIFRP